MEPLSAPAPDVESSRAVAFGLRWRAALLLMMASGCAALGYQIVWTQQSALWLGHESAAVLAVMGAFFGGLALGALALGPRIDRSPKPGRWYAACEAAIGLWSLALALLLKPLATALVSLIGSQPTPMWHGFVAFCGTFALLLPATAAMGATLPAMERMLDRMRGRGESIAGLYASNTLGAVLGVLGTAFVLVPALGLWRTAAVCTALNLVCAAAVVRLFAGPAEVASAGRIPQSARVPWVLAATGLLGIGYEVLVVRVLSQVAENTVFTFALLLAVYLVGTALGAAAYGRWRSRMVDARRTSDGLLRMLAASCLLGTAILHGAPALEAAVRRGMGSALAAEAAIATAAFLPPSILMGALFSHLATTARSAGIGFGRALGVNTLGATLAPLLFGVLLLPALGLKTALAAVAIGYLALSSRRGWLAPTQWAVVGATVMLAVLGPSLRIVDVPPGGRVIRHVEGVMAAVSIVEDAGGVSSLHINNRQQEGSSATVFADARQALLPMLLHPGPRRALFLGLGTGITAASAAEDRELHVDAVELLPEVIEASAHFIGATAHPRLHLMAADARRYVRTARERYDLIVSDNFHPARSGSGSLYTAEHFAAVRDRLAPGGLFCQWLPLHQLDLDTLRSIVRTFVTVYPKAWAMLATNSLDTPVLGLIAFNDGRGFEPAAIRTRLSRAALPYSPDDFGIADEYALLGGFVAGPRALARFASDAPLNTDDRPVVAYQAPRITYVPDSLPRDRLSALLQELDIQPDELKNLPDPGWASRLSAYWVARDRFIEAGRDVEPSADVRRMLAQVREPLLSVLRVSPDFRPAYDPLLSMAIALGSVDSTAARRLLTELHRVQPFRPEAAEALRVLTAHTP